MHGPSGKSYILDRPLSSSFLHTPHPPLYPDTLARHHYKARLCPVKQSNRIYPPSTTLRLCFELSEHPTLSQPKPTMASANSSNVVGVHYRVGKKIGEGSFGVIFEGHNLINQNQVAIKFVSRSCPVRASSSFDTRASLNTSPNPRSSDRDFFPSTVDTPLLLSVPS